MNLTPIDVEQKAFTQALRGYQMDEVDDFLDEVVSTLRSYEQRIREAHDKIRVLESESTPANRGGGDESEIARAILTAQRSADRLLAEARTEAEAIKSEAITETSQLRAERDAERTRLHQEVKTMSGLVAALRSKLGELSAAVLAQLDQMDSEIDATHSGLGVDDSDDLPTDVAEEELLDDFDAITAEEEVDQPEAGEDNPPSFSDIFPEPEVDLTEPRKSRVSSRPWERG